MIGYCSGGGQSFLAACSLPLDAAVDCYGAFVTGAPPEGMPLKVGPIKHLTKDLSCPLLGLFGADDQYPSPEQVNELEEELKAQGKTYEFHSYQGAGHASLGEPCRLPPGSRRRRLGPHLHLVRPLPGLLNPPRPRQPAQATPPRPRPAILTLPRSPSAAGPQIIVDCYTPHTGCNNPRSSE